jgi:3',5'-cyclic AMP phosphodiesterase CpdA
MTDSTIVRFVHVTDSHIGADRVFVPRDFGAPTQPRAAAVVEAINAIDPQPDFVLHGGDVVHAPSAEAYAIARETFARLRAPLLVVCGNHDDPEEVSRLLPSKPARERPDPDRVTYAFSVGAVRFVVLDARPAELPDGEVSHGFLDEASLSFLRREAERSVGPVVLFVHYPPLPLDSAWLARGMLITNGVALHELLVSLRPRVPAVLFGHIHRGVHVIRDGVLYSSVSSTSCPFTCWPADARIRFDPMHPPAFHYVSVEVPAAKPQDATVVVKAHLAPAGGPA